MKKLILIVLFLQLLLSYNNLISQIDEIIIGNQVWMLKNMEVTTYRNGDEIPQVTDPTEWANLTTGAWCYYNNDPSLGAIYGKLYNWYAVNDSRGLAPEGWHIPSDNEFKILEMYLGMTQAQADGTLERGTNEGGKMKEQGTSHWLSPNTGSTNSSGFTAISGGWRNYPGNFEGFNRNCYFWTSTEGDATYPWYRNLTYVHAKIDRSKNAQKKDGFSIRCVSDYAPPVNLELGLVAFYPFCGTVRDESGNNSHGIAKGATPTTDRFGNSNKAYNFDGINDTIIIPTSNHPTGNPNLTYSLWYFIQSQPTGPAYSLIDAGDPLNDYKSSAIHLFNYSPAAFRYVSRGTGGLIEFLSYRPSTGQWHHLVLKKNGNNGSLYIDGQLKESGTIQNQNIQTTKIVIGGNGTSYSSGELFSGKLDDIRIYNRALNDAEILALFNEGSIDCSQYPSITTNSLNSSYCEGDQISIPFTINGTYNSGNIFTAQLSNSNGNFASPTNIGTLTGTTAGTINATIPAGVSGSGFRVRVVSSNPAVTGSDNGANITINPLPTPSIEEDDDDICAGNEYEYKSNVDNNVDYKWKAVGGSIPVGEDDEDEVHVRWGTGSTGTVWLIQTDKTTGCKDSVSLDVTINPLPVPQISGSVDLCKDERLKYYSNKETGMKYQWIVSGGSIIGNADEDSLLVNWNTAGSGKVKLIQTNSNNCIDSVEKDITINALPNPGITGGNSICIGTSVTYNSNVAGGLTYVWVVTGGTLVSGQSTDKINVNWGTVGNGKIKLIQTNSTTGCKDSTEMIITINALPSPVITVKPNPVCEKNSYNYESNDDANVNYLWVVTGGTIDAGLNAKSVTVTWGNAGTGSIKLIHTHKTTFCTDTVEINPITINPLPNAVIVGSLTAGSNNKESYKAKDSSGVSSAWSVTGGSILGSTIKHHAVVNWGIAGSGKLILIQTDNQTQCKDTAIIDVSILDNPPIVISISDSACEFHEYIYTTISSANILNTWKVIKGGAVVGVADQTSVKVKWDKSGTGTLRLVQKNKQLNTFDSLTKEIIIHPLPKPEFKTIIDSAYEGSTMKYRAKTGTNLSYIWQVTKGNIIGANNRDSVEVKWTSIGIGTIRLIEINNLTSCMDTLDSNIEIKEKIGLKISGNTDVCEYDSASYSTSDIINASNNWIVTSGTITTQTNTILIVAWGAKGTGKIKLIQNNQDLGIQDSIEIEVNIHALPVVELDDFPDICYYDTTYQLTGGKPIGGIYYFDDTVRTQFNPIKRGVGNHSIRYEFTDTLTGCKNFAENTILINPIPIAHPNSNTFSVWSESKELSYEWYYGDPLEIVSTDSVYFPSKDQEGEYYLKVVNEFGCESELSDGVVYFPPNPEGPRITSKGKLDYSTLICETFAYDTVTISNVGAEKLIISKAEITGNDKVDFSPSSFTPPDIEIESKKSRDFIIKFEPKNVGLKQAELLIECNDTKRPSYTIGITGKKDSVGFELSDTIIKFEWLNVGETPTKNITITNTGSIPLDWSLSSLKSKDFEIISIKPNPTEPNGGTSILRIIFNGGTDGYKALVEYYLEDEICGDSVKLILEATVGGKPVEAYATIKVDSSIGIYEPGDYVKIPVRLYSQTNLTNVTGFTADLVFNSSLLVPNEDTDMGQSKNNSRTISLPLAVNPIKDNIIYNLYFIATLGNDTTTALSLINLKSIGGNVNISNIDGRFTLSGVCMEGDTPRLLNIDGSASIKLIRPNPTENKLTIDYELIEKGQTEIYLLNSFGERVKTIVSGETGKGKYTIESDLNELGSGLYFIILETPTVRKAEKVEIIK